MENIKIVTAKTSDTPSIIDIFTKVRSQMKYLPIIHTLDETEKYLVSLVSDGNVLVAKRGNSILGFSQLKDGFVNHLYIDPHFQNKGVGKLLLDEMKQLSSDNLKLWVFEENKNAIRFYEREGFKLEEKRDKEHTENEENLPDRLYSWTKES
jgi:ribosomal protein S18 acetylase RimI-like enzyme